MSINFIDIYVGHHQEFLRSYDNNIDYSFSNETIRKILEHLGIADDGTVQQFVNRLLKADAIISSNPNSALQELLKKANPKLKHQITANWKTVEAIFKDYYNERFHIIWGYYSILDSESKSLLYLLGKNFKENNSIVPNIEAFWNFSYIPLPTSISDTSIGDIINKISLDDKRFFNKEFHETPTIYRANSWTLDENKLKELFSNTFIQDKNNTSSFSVILTEEVLFFLYAFLHFSSDNKATATIWEKLHLSENYKDDKFYIPIVPNLKQLCKFALSVESLILKKNQKPFLNYFELSGYWEDWKNVKELSLRRKIDAFVDSKLVRLPIDKFLEEIHPKIVAIFELLISHTQDYINSIENGKIKNQLLQRYFKASPDKLGVIEFLARFNIEASKLILEDTTQKTLHDIFMFPMVKTWKEGFRTNNLPYDDCLNDDKEVDINIPVIMTTYINSLYSINGALDEDESSLNGFNITMEVCRNLAKPIVESEFYGRVIKSKLLPKALQSAVAQVFARNFAHNIGSHVAIRATNRMAKERIEELYKIKKADFKNIPEIESWLDYMGEKLDLFEVARNEFLAEYKLPAKNAMLYRDVILPFCENTLLMDNIAHSEGIHYGIDGQNNKLKIKVFIKGVNEPKGKEITAAYPYLKGYKTDGEILYPDKFPYLLESREIEVEGKKIKYTIDEAFTNKPLTGTNDIEICLTNEHTLYSILENLIRNSAKHNKSAINETEGLIISVNIEDENDDYYRVQISDNVSNVSEEQLNKFAKSIAASLITNDGEIQKESLGIADIKINAHLLKTDADITNGNLSQALTLVYDKEENKIFKPYTTEVNPSEEKTYNFGYQFKLCKPKKVIWIGRAGNVNLKKKGIICIENYKNFKPEGQAKTEEPLANYQFAILELEAVKELTNELIFKDAAKKEVDNKTSYQWDDFLIKLPHRVLLNCTKKEFDELTGEDYAAIKELEKDGRIQLVKQKIKLPTETEGDENKDWDFDFLKDCWESWLRKWLKNDDQASLIVYFEDENKAKQWQEITKEFTDVKVNFLSSVPLTNGLEIDDKERVVIYDHHAKGLVKIENDSKAKIDFINRGAYFQFGKNSQDFIKFFFPSNNNNQNILFLFEAYEAGLNKIVVVDERIAEMLNYNDPYNIGNNITCSKKFNTKKYIGEYGDLGNNGNVFIVSKFIKSELNSIKKNMTLSFSNQFTVTDEPFACKEQLKFDSLIIHRTHLISLFEEVDSRENTNKLSKREMMHLLYKKFNRVVVVSGGGYPHSINFKVQFKPFSQLKNSFIQYPSKISLNNIV